MQQYIQEQTTWFKYEYPWTPFIIIHVSTDTYRPPASTFSARFHTNNFGPIVYVFQGENLLSRPNNNNFVWSNCFHSFLTHHLATHQICDEKPRQWNKQKLRNENGIDDPECHVRIVTPPGIYPVDIETDIQIWMDPMAVREWGVEGASWIAMRKPELICSLAELFALSHLYKISNIRLFALF